MYAIFIYFNVNETIAAPCLSWVFSVFLFSVVLIWKKRGLIDCHIIWVFVYSPNIMNLD